MDSASLRILTDLLFECLSSSPTGVDPVRFRIAHEDDIDLIDELLRRSYISDNGGKYRPKLVAIIKLADSVDEAKVVIENGARVFPILKDFYRKTPNMLISLETLSSLSGISRTDLNNAVRNMDEAMILMGRSTGFPDEESAAMSAGERILKFASYSAALAEVVKIHSHVEINHRAFQTTLAKMSESELLLVERDRGGFSDFKFLLHDRIISSSLQKFNDGHVRAAVLDAMSAVSEHLREATNRSEDGEKLISMVFSEKKPLLKLGNLETALGKDIHRAFVQIFRGVYQGIRNPHTHFLNLSLSKLEAAQYLVLASMLAGKIDEATTGNRSQQDLKSGQSSTTD